MEDLCNLKLNIKFIPQNKIKEVTQYLKKHCVTSKRKKKNSKIQKYEIENLNYGGYVELNYLAKLGVIFSGYHTKGQNYPSYDFVTMENAVYYSIENGPIAKIYEDGNIDKEDLENAKKYYTALKKFNDNYNIKTR